MKKILLTALVAMAAQQMLADDYKYLTIYDKVGNASCIPLATLQKITFTATDMQVQTTEGDQAFALSSLLKMAFQQTPTPIDGIDAATNGELKYAQGSLVVGPESKGQTLCVYSQNGALVAQQKVGANGAAINLNTLPKGIYIARIGNTAIKIAK